MIRRNAMIPLSESLEKLVGYLPAPKSSSIVVDGGANVGDFTELLLRFFPETTIVGFEPTPYIATEYRKRFADRKNVTLVEGAISSASGTATLHINGEMHKTNSLLPRPSSGKKYYGKKSSTTDTITIKTYDLDTLLSSRYPDCRIDLLKMDLQGGELDALKGMTQLLYRQAVGVFVLEAMFIEHYERQPLLKDVWNFVAGFGYTLYDLCDVSWMLDDGQIRQGDVIFVSSAIRKRL